MPLGKLFHVMQIVDDFDQASERINRLFDPYVYAPKGWSDFDKRWASLAMIGPDMCYEIMEPSKLDEDAGYPLPKFHRRHGAHLHSFAWYVDGDLAALAERMRAQGIRVIDPYENVAAEGGTFFTHPKDTFGQLEFQSPSGEFSGRSPMLDPNWSGAEWRDEHPLGLLRTAYMTTVVADLDRAKSFYQEAMEAPIFFEEETEDRRSAFSYVGIDHVVELAQPNDTESRLSHDLAEHGELPHAVVFEVADLDAAEEHAKSSGFGIAEKTGDTFLVEPADLANALIGFTTRRLPGDPRPTP